MCDIYLCDCGGACVCSVQYSEPSVHCIAITHVIVCVMLSFLKLQTKAVPIEMGAFNGVELRPTHFNVWIFLPKQTPISNWIGVVGIEKKAGAFI